MPTKVVNGRRRELTPEEVAQRQADEAPPTTQEIEAKVEQDLASITDRASLSDKEKATFLLFADLWRFLNTGVPSPDPTMTAAEARAAVKARLRTHLRDLQGL